MKNKEGKGEPWKRGKKENKNKEGKEEPWKRGKKGMNNREGKEGSWKRGKRGMKTKAGKEEPWKRGKVKPEKREGDSVSSPREATFFSKSSVSCRRQPTVGTHPGIHRIQRIQSNLAEKVSFAAVRTPLPHAQEAKMTVVTNSLK